jgi:hypothetical protein
MPTVRPESSPRPLAADRVRWALGLPVILGFVLTAVGCATVKPSEREVLSRPEMNPATEGMEEQFQSHVESAREGGFGGHGAAGGGCGCG